MARIELALGVMVVLVALVELSGVGGTTCPGLMDRVWEGYAPRGGEGAGRFKSPTHQPLPLRTCVSICCRDTTCNVVFVYNDTCYQIECSSDEDCIPVLRSEPKFGQYAQMVLVRTVDPTLQWDDILDANNNSDDLAMSGSELLGVKSCSMNSEAGFNDCGLNEVCVAQQNKRPASGAGICDCRPGYVRNSDNICVLTSPVVMSNSSVIQSLVKPVDLVAPAVSTSKFYGEGGGLEVSSETPPPKKLVVSVISKQVRLPDNEVTLSAFTVPAEIPGETHYTYKWKLLSQPEGTVATSETHGSQLKLTHLTQGLYTFKVSVSGAGVFGEAEANVTVLPQKRVNEPPVVIVLPPHQTVKLPNSKAVLDASSSRDDAGITKFHWELQQGPLGYQPTLTDSQTLQLKDLHKPGNYTFRLTVTDTDGATNSTIANITVLEVADYPPEANAGSSQVIYLPRNNVTLNGNLSSDDRGIVSWEWTKSPGDHDKAVDMQNTHTPYLQLSHLEEGMYTFVLKVTDDAGQSSVNDVHVFVKPPTNKPPVADAGGDVSIALPQTWIILNGSHSSDDIGIVSWKWEEISGPNKVVFSHGNESVTNVTGLTKGEYKFQLKVIDGNDNEAIDSVSVIVTQNKNAPPKANAGGDQTVWLPVDVLVINGSESSDDLGIAKWQWTREPTSLAMGTIISHSDTTPVLMLTNVVAGRYEFRLRVTDDQGEWSEDTVSIILKPDKERLNLVELTLNIEAGQLTQSQRDSVLLKLGLLLHDASQLVARELRADTSGRALLVFYVAAANGVSVPGPAVVKTLKEKLHQDSLLLHLSVANIQTTVCQNNCSGHGVCEQETRVCLCEAFWMEDLFNKYLGDGESNCDWSILYVMIGVVSCIVLAVGCVWGLGCICNRLCCQDSTHCSASAPSSHHTSSNLRYALLNTTDQVKLPMGKVVLSDSDTDSDVLFENRHGKTNGTKPSKNGFKTDRRIKT